MKKQKSAFGLTREQEREASRFFGQHVSFPKALSALLAALLCCLSPTLLGLRLWEAIPPIVPTGLISTEGLDDSMPRAVLVFGVPGLFAVLTLICHGQLWLHQKAQKLPPLSVRLLGRWTLPVLAVLLCPLWLLHAAGETVTGRFYLPCALALLLLCLGAHFFDCARESRFAFRLKSIVYKEAAWRRTHRAASLAWMAAGLLLLFVYFALGRMPAWSAIATLALLLVPLPAAGVFAKETIEK